ncbi:hypothetical protein QVD17_24422 [Tagetes erecta]|uniref:Uncharacterized protein n=1 Tax=Tagetes erecta TaxID=13708 RepID=A0AAD8KF54_TARER|nr:hypothetical protein QVD17_24422 [Tagetes erecta]
MSTSLTPADLKNVATISPPKLTDDDNFDDWKVRLKDFYLTTDHTQWDSIVLGQHTPIRVIGDATIRNTDPSSYTDRDKRLIERDNRAFDVLKLCLTRDSRSKFAEHKNAKSLYDALCRFHDERKKRETNKRVLVEKDFIAFVSHKREKLSDLINRFLNVTKNLKKYHPYLTNYYQIHRLVDSLPTEWSNYVKVLKKERFFSDYKLMDIVDKLKNYDIEMKRKEFFQEVLPQQTNTLNVDLISSVTGILNYKTKLNEKLKVIASDSETIVGTSDNIQENCGNSLIDFDKGFDCEI